MKTYIKQTAPFVVPTTDGKVIKEHFGLASDGSSNLSVAHMVAPPGWSEPFQTPQFDEITFVIAGKKQFVIGNEIVVLCAGESIKILKNTSVQYSNPFDLPCEYISICTPAFSLERANRED